MSVLLGILTFILIIVSLFIVLVVLAQKTKDGGMGAALGGGAAEATFGAETANVLSKSTIWAAVIFFILAFALYLGRIYERKVARDAAGTALPSITAPAVPPAAPVTGAPATSAPAATTPATTAPSSTTGAATPAAPAATTPAPSGNTPAPEPTKKQPNR